MCLGLLLQLLFFLLGLPVFFLLGRKGEDQGLHLHWHIRRLRTRGTKEKGISAHQQLKEEFRAIYFK
jgi:hypothetical protein